jgi:hypothetical protein
MKRYTLKEYSPNKQNELLFVVSDQVDAKTKLPLQVKTIEDLERFFDELTTLAGKYFLDIESFGMKDAMAQRLFIKYQMSKEE